MNEKELFVIFDKWCKKLRITPNWDVKLEIIDDKNWSKTGDFKIDCDDKKAVFMINKNRINDENIEEIIVHELFHLKMYPLDQVTESLIVNNFSKGSKEYDFAYTEFFNALEQTVEELAKCYLLEFGDNKELSFSRCKRQASFEDLYSKLKNIE